VVSSIGCAAECGLAMKLLSTCKIYYVALVFVVDVCFIVCPFVHLL